MILFLIFLIHVFGSDKETNNGVKKQFFKNQDTYNDPQKALDFLAFKELFKAQKLNLNGNECVGENVKEKLDMKLNVSQNKQKDPRGEDFTESLITEKSQNNAVTQAEKHEDEKIGDWKTTFHEIIKSWREESDALHKLDERANDASAKESCHGKQNRQDCFENETQKKKANVKQQLPDFKISLIGLREWLVGHGLSDEGKDQALIERIGNFRKRPQLQEPELASNEFFKISMIEASKIEKAQNKIYWNHQIKSVMIEPKALNLNKIQDGLVVNDPMFLEIEAREKCKDMKKKGLQDWLVNESGCKSNTWLKVSNEELTNRICKSILKNSQIRETEMKKSFKIIK